MSTVRTNATQDSIGDFFFREAILDQLSYYFRIIRKIKQLDPDAYRLYSLIGGHIIPERLMPNAKRLTPATNATRPTFGMGTGNDAPM